MRALQREEVVGRRIVEVVVSVPDRPVTMSTMSYSASYLRLDSGSWFDLGQPTVPPLYAVYETVLRGVVRDPKGEKEFRPLLQQVIVDVVLTIDDGSLCVLTDEFVIAVGAGQFWVGPYLAKRASFTDATEPFWPSSGGQP
jgi:hypothetical protein